MGIAHDPVARNNAVYSIPLFCPIVLSDPTYSRVGHAASDGSPKRQVQLNDPAAVRTLHSNFPRCRGDLVQDAPIAFWTPNNDAHSITLHLQVHLTIIHPYVCQCVWVFQIFILQEAKVLQSDCKGCSGHSKGTGQFREAFMHSWLKNLI